MDRLDCMTTALAVARAGSLSAAGRVLKMPVATVSRKVSELEAHLGVQLFVRSSRRLTLTPAGEAYLPSAQRVLEALAAAERTASGEYQAPVGTLSITTPIAFGQMHVLPVAHGFLEAYSQIDLRVYLSERTVNLTEDQVDVALRIGPLPDSQLVARFLGDTRRVVCASPDYLARRGTPHGLDDLAHHDGITLESIASVRGWTFAPERNPTKWTPPFGKIARQNRESDQRDVAVPIRPRLTVNTTRAALDAAVAGVGLVRALGYQVAEEVAAGRLRIVLEGFEPRPWPIHLVHVAQGPIPLKVRAFLDWSAPRLRARLTTA